MPSTLNTFDSSEIKLRYREPYFSAGINSKFAAVVARGVYRGFGMEAGSGDNILVIKSDASATDHALVYETQTGYSVTVRKTGGDFSLNLSSLVSATEQKTWAIAVSVTYDIGTTTSAELRAYEVYPSDTLTTDSEFPELIVLGTVTLPAASSSPIPAANILPAYRTAAWANQAPDTLKGVPQVQNSSFASGRPILTSTTRSPSWEREFSGGTEWSLDTVDPRTGIQHLKVRTATGPVTVAATQHIGTEFKPDTRLKVRVYKKVVDFATAGTGEVILTFKEPDGVTEHTVTTTFNILTAVDADYVEIDASTYPPVGTTTLDKITIQVNAATWAVPGNDGVYIDDVQIWAEADTGPARGVGQVLEPGMLSLYGQSTGDVNADGNAARITTKGGDAARYVLLFQGGQPSGGERYRIYQVDADIIHCSNARYDHATAMWYKDVTGKEAHGFRMGNGTSSGFQYMRALSGDDDWPDSFWGGPAPLFLRTTSMGVMGGGGGGVLFYRPGYPSTFNLPFRNYSPLGNRDRYYIDGMGFPPGQLRRIDNHWELNPRNGISSALEDWGWFKETGTFGTSTVTASPYWIGRHCQLSSASAFSVFSRDLFTWNGTNGADAHGLGAFSLRWKAVIPDVTSLVVWMGLTDDEYFDDHKGYALRYDSAGAGTWEFFSGDTGGTPESTDTTIVPADDVPHSFRLDFIGDELNTGYRSVLYIDGVERANHSGASLITTSDICKIAFRCDPISGTRNLYIGPVTLMYYMPSVFGSSWLPFG